MQDKRIVVAGGFGVLGRSLMALLDEVGAYPIAIDATPSPQFHQGAAYGNVDINNESEVLVVMEKIAADGGLDGLVNVAGGFVWETILDGEVATWDRLYQMNLRTALVMSKYAAPLLKVSKGAIVNVGAAAAAKAALGMGAYTASKSGVARLTEALAEELKADDVRVNAVLPSIIDTAANRSDMPDADASRWVSPEELAQVIVFLLSDKASAITGALIPVTGRV